MRLSRVSNEKLSGDGVSRRGKPPPRTRPPRRLQRLDSPKLPNETKIGTPTFWNKVTPLSTNWRLRMFLKAFLYCCSSFANNVNTYVMESSSSAVSDPDSRKTVIRPSSDFNDIVGHFVQNE